MRTVRSRILSASVVAVAAAALAGPTAAEGPQLVGTVGPGFTIGLEDAAGKAVTQLDPGTYELVVHDLGDIHNFHLFGPGVDVQTDIEFVGDKTFTVTFKDGRYTYLCDPHGTAMIGRFTVGNPPIPTPKPKSAALRVGPGLAIAAPARLAAGRYSITVRDLSGKDNVHLVGPGLNRKTGVVSRGTVTWTVTLRRGDYRVRSDAHTKLARTIVVS